MRYDFVVSYAGGSYHLWNKKKDNEWNVMFEDEKQMLKFMQTLLEETQ